MKIIPIIITAGVALFAVEIFIQAYTEGSIVMAVYGFLVLGILWICISILRSD